jgi:exodeoxyribonuclease VII large subunit
VALVEGAAVRLATVDPRRVLGRGYAMLSDGGGHPVSSVAATARGDRLVASVSDGQADVVESLTAAPTSR